MKLFWRIVLGLAAIFLVFYLITQPEAAADAVQGIGAWITAVGNAIARFFTALST